MFAIIGSWVYAKYTAQQAHKGTYQAALNMKKQGYPIELALFVLTGRV